MLAVPKALTRKLGLVITVVFLVSLALAALAPVAASAEPSGGRRHAGVTLRCVFLLASYQKADASRVVRLVRSEYDDVAPSGASAELQELIAGFYAEGCGPTLNVYVNARTNNAQYAWYKAVVVEVLSP